MPRLFDTHIHLFRIVDAAGCLARFNAFSLSIAPDDWSGQLSLAESHGALGLHVGLGLHPWQIHTITETWETHVKMLETHLLHRAYLQVGEVGLDFDRRTPAEPALQKQVFERLLDVAHRYDRAVSVHVRKAYDEALAIMRNFPGLRIFLHGFGGGAQVTERYLDHLNCVIGVNGVVVRENARRYHAMVRAVGLAHLVLETDGPFVNLPGRARFSCEDIETVCSTVARLLDVPPEQVAARTRENALRMLNDTR